MEECRIIVQQPGLRKYRIPFFREWAGREGVILKLLYAERTDDSGSGEDDCFDSEWVPMWSRTVGGHPVMWHSAQWKSAARGACDVLVLSWNTQYLSLVPALLRARLNGIKVILWGHGYSKKDSRVRKFLRDAVGRLAHALVFYDYHTAQQFVRAGWSEKKIHVAPNSLYQVEIQQTRSDWLKHEDSLASFRQERGLAGRENIIYIGRMYAENRLDVLLQALAEVRKTHPEAQLLLIGRGDEEERRLRLLAEQLHVADAVQWLGAVYSERDIAPFMLSSRLFCYPANIGLSIMHAMGYGLPVITGDDVPSHNPEIHVLEDGVTGCLFRHLDAEDLALKIGSLLNDPERIKSMGTSARKTVLESFTTQKMVDGVMKAVDSVLTD